MDHSTLVRFFHLVVDNWMYTLLPVLELLVFIFWFGHFTRRKLAHAFARLRGEWQTVLDVQSHLAKQMAATSFVLQAPNFSGRTKQEYDKALANWALWLASYHFMVGLLSKATSLEALQSRVPTWSLSKKHIRAAIALLNSSSLAINAKALPEQLQAVLGPLLTEQTLSASQLHAAVNAPGTVKSSFETLDFAVKSAAACLVEIELSINPPEPSDNRIEKLLRDLNAKGLLLKPYKPQIAELEKLQLAFAECLTSNPLEDYSRAKTKMLRKIRSLRLKLQKASRSKDTFDAINKSISPLQRQIEEKLASSPKSHIAGLVFEGNYTLSESRYALPVMLQACLASVEEICRLLDSGNLVKFSRIAKVLPEEIETLKSKIAKVEADKARVDAILDRVQAESTDADRAVDHDAFARISGIYGRQHWHAACKLAEEFLLGHDKRVGARAELAALTSAFAQMLSQIEERKTILSLAPETQYHELDRELGKIATQAALGSTDWDLVCRKVATLSARLTGDGKKSLATMITSELKVHAIAMETLATVVTELSYATDKVAEKWGGDLAADRLAEAVPSVMSLSHDSAQARADWKELHVRARAVLAELAQVRSAIDAEIAIYNQLLAKLDLCQHMIDRMNGPEAYVYEIAGHKIGSMIFAQTAPFAKMLLECRQIVERRSYAEAQSATTQAKRAIASENLECYWLLLQALSLTGVPVALEYATQNGYELGRFESWLAPRVSVEDGFFILEKVAIGDTRLLDLLGKTPALVDGPLLTDYSRPA